MTTQEAIERLREFCKLRAFCELYPDACQKDNCEIYMAIEALQQQNLVNDSQGFSQGDYISRQEAIDAVKTYWKKVVDDIPKGVGFEEMTQLCDMALEHNANILKAIDQLPSAQPEIIRCKDCYWWEKQEASLQGRCDRYGFYPTGYWYCAGARERKDNG